MSRSLLVTYIGRGPPAHQQRMHSLSCRRRRHDAALHRHALVIEGPFVEVIKFL